MSEEKTVNTLIRDFFGVVALAFTVFSVMALITFSPDDTSFNKSVTGNNVENSVGMIGAYFSGGLASMFGSGSFFFPVITVFLSWALVRGKGFYNLPLILSSGLLFLVGLCSLLAIQFDVDPFFGSSVPVGGLIGHSLGGFLIDWLNPSGAVLTLITLLFVAFLVMTRIPVKVLMKGLGNLFKIIAAASMMAIVKITNIALKGLSAIKTFIGKIQTVRQEIRKSQKSVAQPLIITRNRTTEPSVKKPGKKETKEETAEFVVQDHFSFMSTPGKYQVPPLSLLEEPPPGRDTQDDKARDEILASSAILEKKLLDFGIDGRVVQVLPGPVITLFEYEPAGNRLCRIWRLLHIYSWQVQPVRVRASD